jgi:tetratricopeptide (TPR) repeat protein
MAAQRPPHGATIQGTVLDSTGSPVSGVLVRLAQPGILSPKETKTDATGSFTFSDLPTGNCTLSAGKAGLRASATVESMGNDQKHIDLVLAPSQSENPSIEFSDQPNFTVAGVMDWTAVGGHGSDSTLRTSEDLARETLVLKPQTSDQSTPGGSGSAIESNLRAALASDPASFESNHQLGAFYLHAGRFSEALPLLQAADRLDPANNENAYDLALAMEQTGNLSRARDYVQKLLSDENSADLHRLKGELDEKLGDPLAAVNEDEQAVHLDPSEQNYFAWGSELLLHRAVWQAVEVFRDGAKAYPKSARMLTALGTALFAGALYDEAALKLCDASDLNPAGPEPYIFMGKIEMASPTPLPCVEQKLARFAQEQPENSLANYLYAMAIWKRQHQPADPEISHQVEALLTKAVTVDPKCADADLQLGVLYASRRDYPKAIDFYTQAIEANPQLGEAHYRLGVAYDRSGETEKAKQEFRLHDEIEKQQADAVERQRRDIKQFLVVLQGQSTHPPVH